MIHPAAARRQGDRGRLRAAVGDQNAARRLRRNSLRASERSSTMPAIAGGEAGDQHADAERRAIRIGVRHRELGRDRRAVGGGRRARPSPERHRDQCARVVRRPHVRRRRGRRRRGRRPSPAVGAASWSCFGFAAPGVEAWSGRSRVRGRGARRPPPAAPRLSSRSLEGGTGGGGGWRCWRGLRGRTSTSSDDAPGGCPVRAPR